MATREVTLKLNAQGDAEKKLGALDTKLGGINTSMLAIVGAAAAVGTAVATFVSKGIEAYSKFDSALTEIEARTSLTDEEMEKVAETAKRMGLETAFSATDAANGMLQLITSGSDAAEAMALLPDVMDLAAASGLDLETSADLLTDVMKQFGLSAADSTRIVDVLVAASQSSSATVWDMAQAFMNGGTVAALFGVSIEDAAASVAVLAENGVKGTEAGTQFKSMLLNMNRDTKKSEVALGDIGFALKAVEAGYTSMAEAGAAYEAGELSFGATEQIDFSFFDEATGDARDFLVVQEELNKAFSIMTDQQQTKIMKDLFGSYGLIAGGALDAAGGIEAMREDMEGQNSAAEVAAEQLESFDNQVGLLESSIEGLMLDVVGPFVEDVLKPMLPILMSLINGFTRWVSEGDKVSAGIQIVQAFLTVLMGIIQNVVGVVVKLIEGDFVGAFEHLWAMIQQYLGFIEGIFFTVWGNVIILTADFFGALIGGALEGLDGFVKLFQSAFHGIRVFVHGVALGVVQMVESLINAVTGGIEDFLKGPVRSALDLVAGTIFDVGGFASNTIASIDALDLAVDLTSNLGPLPEYTPTGLNLGDDIRGRVSEGIRGVGQRFVDRGAQAFENAQNVQVTNVNVEVGTNVGDNDELVRVINNAARAGRLR